MLSSTRARHGPVFRLRATALGCAAALGALSGCRSTTMAASASHLGGERVPSAVTAYVVEPQPRILVTPDAGAYLVLGAGPVQVGAQAAWSITYLASPDVAAASAPDANERLGLAAEALRLAQQLVAQAAGADLLSVTAVLGAPGERGTTEQIVYARQELGWERISGPVRGEMQAIPALPARIERDPGAEAAALRVALDFLGHVERLDYDAAWELSSAVVKATMSRATFAAQLRAFGVGVTAEPRELYRSFPLSLRGFIPGSELEVWFARRASGGSGLDTVQLRLDDDQEWRVAGVREIAPADHLSPAASGMVTTRRPE